jgi:hypothetical protein
MKNLLEVVVAAAGACLIVLVLPSCGPEPGRQPAAGRTPGPAAEAAPSGTGEAPAPGAPAPAAPHVDPLAALVRPPADVVWAEGLAIALLIDTSGSMRDQVADADGARRPKIDIAKRSCRRVIDGIEKFAARNPDKKLQVGLYEFSGTKGREILPMGPLRADDARRATDALVPKSGTPIGEAMLLAKGDLDRTGLARRHLLVLTDGENTAGRDPAAVARAVAALPEADRAGIHFVAFDVEAARFEGIKAADGTVLEARGGADLDRAMEFILEKKILLELPDPVPGK